MPHILVVDDSHEHLEIIQDIFETEGYHVTVCDNAFNALKILTEHNFDAIITDLKIPVLDGNHLLTIIHEKYPEVPVIVLSAYVNDEQELLDKGAYAVLRKPPNISALVSNVDNAIHEAGHSISFVFCHTNLKKMQDTLISRMISLALKKTDGNQLKAAAMLGISRQSLIRYMKKFQISK